MWRVRFPSPAPSPPPPKNQLPFVAVAQDLSECASFRLSLRREAGAGRRRKAGEATMATVKLLKDEELSAEAQAVFADIRATRQSDFVNNFWRALAHDPVLLKRSWEGVKSVMAPGAIDPKVKEMIYVAVSAAHGCAYCVHSHTAGARAKGMTEAEYRELLAIIGMAAETNRLVTALGVPIDDAFLVDDA
jgi:AhpD family alkylhydroperoxidase